MDSSDNSSIGRLWLSGSKDQLERRLSLPAGLHWASDNDLATWIHDRLSPASTSATLVSSVMPSGFEAYARVFHPAINQHGRDVRWSAVAAANGKVMHAEAQWEFIANEHRSNWHVEPELGRCPPAVLNRLLGVLDATDMSGCGVAVWEGYAGANTIFSGAPLITLGSRRYWLAQGVAASLAAQEFSRLDIGMNYIWALDQEWCISTNVDFRWTYVGGPTTMIEAILAAGQIEALPASLDHRADIHGDLTNMDSSG